MKNFLRSSMGVVGIIIWYMITIILTFMPLTIVHWNFIVEALIIAAVLFIPFIGSIVQFAVWAITLPMVVTGPFDIVAIVYYVALAVYLFAYVVPFLLSIPAWLSAWRGKK